MSRSNIPIPFFPVPPEEYSRRYLSEVTRSFSLYAGQLQSALGGDAQSGVVTLDFGAGSATATVDVTSLPLVKSTDVIMVATRIEATADHTVSFLLTNPIRVVVSAISPGTGFTIHGTEPGGTTTGKYIVNWVIADT